MKSPIIILLVWAGFFSNLSWAVERSARSYLAAYGAAYCLSKIGSQEIKTEADMAMGGYLQLSSYENENAYRAVRKFVDGAVPNPVPVYQGMGKNAALMVCLNLAQKQEFNKLILLQDRYLPGGKPQSR